MFSDKCKYGQSHWGNLGTCVQSSGTGLVLWASPIPSLNSTSFRIAKASELFGRGMELVEQLPVSSMHKLVSLARVIYST